MGTGNPLAQAVLTLTSTRDTHGHPLSLTSSGGSGTGEVTYAVTTVGTAGCSIQGSLLRTVRAGACTVTATKSADATYALVRSLATTVRIAAARPVAYRISSAVWTGRTVRTTIIGSAFYGSPRILSSVGGTTVSVTRDSGRILTIRVRVRDDVPKGLHTFTLIFARGQRTSVRYRQR